VVAGCSPVGGGDPEVLRLKEVVGTIEVAENADAELRSTDTYQGINLLSRGALLRLPEGARVRLSYLAAPTILYLYGPGEFEVGEVRLERSESGIHGKIKDIHATIHMHSGVIAGAMEGPPEDRPSLEVVTSYASARLDPFGKFAVVSHPDEKAGGEAWIRNDRGPEEQRILLQAGGGLGFPPNAVLYWTHEQGPSDEAVDQADRDFVEAFVDRLTLHLDEFEGIEQLLDECSWKRIR
jgi:hypothetical protein